VCSTDIIADSPFTQNAQQLISQYLLIRQITTMIHQRAIQTIFYLLVLFVPSARALSVAVQQCTGDTGTFSIDYLAITCEDYCDWGSDGTFTGSYTIGSTLSTETPVISANIWNVEVYNETIDICDNGNVYNSYGDYCPNTGTYQYVANTELPGSPNSWYSTFSGWLSFFVYITFDFGDAVVQCKVKIEGQSSGSSSSSYMIAGSSVLLAGLAVFRMKRRRTIVLNDEEAESGSGTRFVEMAVV
jgi:hypothetical protein